MKTPKVKPIKVPKMKTSKEGLRDMMKSVFKGAQQNKKYGARKPKY